MGKTIHKKILPKYFDEVVAGNKTFEIRKDEDDIQVGDVLILEEWECGKYTGYSIRSEVIYILRDCPQFGLMPGFCIIGINSNQQKIYQQGKADGAREFAEWLCGKYSRMEQGSIGFVKFQNIYWKSIDEVLAEWQKEVEE